MTNIKMILKSLVILILLAKTIVARVNDFIDELEEAEEAEERNVKNESEMVFEAGCKEKVMTSSGLLKHPLDIFGI